MLTVRLDQEKAIAILEPHGALSKKDFTEAARIIDPFIEKSGKLKGLIIYVQSFPGWDSFSALVTHLEFIKEHHKEITRLAFVTDSAVGNFAEHIGNHFVKAEVKNFDFDDLEDAKAWIAEGNV